MSPTPGIRFVAGLLSALFLAGSAAEAYGLHECPYHHGASGAPSVPTEAPDRPGQGDGPLRPASPGSCTCVGACHGGATTPAYTPDQAALAVPVAPGRFLRRRDPAETAPPRNPGVLLPYATGPPAPVTTAT